MTIKNLTPHTVNILCRYNDDIQGDLERIDAIASDGIARCKQSTVDVDQIGGIRITETQFGEVEGLPKEEPGTFYIVSRLVMAACPDRSDLLVPNEVQRDEKGQITHCLSFARN